MKRSSISNRSILLLALAVSGWFLAAGSAALLLQSRSNPWLVGVQNEPYWSCAVGSGRFKAWLAEPAMWRDQYGWTNSWYRGLDGQSIRWDITVDRGSTGGVIVVAIPLWIFLAAGLAGGIIGLAAWRRRLMTGGHPDD